MTIRTGLILCKPVKDYAGSKKSYIKHSKMGDHSLIFEITECCLTPCSFGWKLGEEIEVLLIFVVLSNNNNVLPMLLSCGAKVDRSIDNQTIFGTNQCLDPDLIWSRYLCWRSLLLLAASAGLPTDRIWQFWLCYLPMVQLQIKINKRSEQCYIFWTTSLDFKKTLFPNLHLSR